MEAPPGEGIFGLDVAPDDARVVLLPVPWEATTSYGRGTARGPRAIHAASMQVDLFDVELGDVERAGIALLPEDPEIVQNAALAAAEALIVIDAYHHGSPAGPDDPHLRRVNELSRWLNDRVAAEAGRWHDAGRLVGLIGGDHSAVYGGIAACAARHPGLGILHFDAHADLRVAYQGFSDSHASIMHNVMALPGVSRLVSVGLRDISAEEHAAIRGSGGRIQAYFDIHLARRKQEGATWKSLCDEIVDKLPDEVYVSFDIDGLDPTLCPHTGTPVPGGLSFHEAMAVLAAVVRSKRRIVAFDLNEVAPGPDGDEWDANVGARVLYKLIGYALASGTAAGT